MYENLVESGGSDPWTSLASRLIAWCSGQRRSPHEQSWLVTYRDRIPAQRRSPIQHPNTNRARRLVFGCWMGDRLWAGIRSRYVTSQLG